MIEAENLTRAFDGRLVVKGVSFAVEPGKVNAFIGPNGAGKTTTLRMLAGFIRPSSGVARILDVDVGDNPAEAQAHIGYLPEGSPLWPELSVRQHLRFFGQARGIHGKALDWAIERTVSTTNLVEVEREPIGVLSKGFQRRVALATCLLHEPEALLLDEPTDGLDPNQKHHIRNLIAALALDKVVIVSTHILEEVDSLAGRVIVVADGKIVADESPRELRARARDRGAVALELPGDASAVRRQLGALPGVAQVHVEQTHPTMRILVYPKPGVSIAGPLGASLREGGTEALSFSVNEGSLEQVFRALTRPGSDEIKAF